MTPLFYEDSFGEKIAQAFNALGSADDELIEDPAALAEAQAEVDREDPEAVYAAVRPDWVAIFGPSKLSGLIDVAGANGCIVTMPLAAQGIPFAWDPYPPEEMPGPSYPAEHGADIPFTLYVAPHDAQRARALITAVPGSTLPAGLPSVHELEPEAASARHTLAWTLSIWFLGLNLLMLTLSVLYSIYQLLRYGSW